MLEIPIIWVEIGRDLPFHLKKNIKLHRALFPQVKQYLLTDSKKIEGLEDFCSTIELENYPNFVLELSELKNRMVRETKQQEFWLNTSSRFIALNEIMKQGNFDKLIHLESDCILLNYEAVAREFHDKDWKIAYPMQAREIGCASILLIQGKEGISDFVDYLKSFWSELDQDDMKLLGKFAESSHVKKLPVDKPLPFKYDPVIFGRYLFGTDARNCRFPFSARGLIDESIGAEDPRQFRYLALDENMPRLASIRETSDGFSNVEYLINLHMHSKRIPDSKRKLYRLMSRELIQERNWKWKLGHLDSRVFLERLISFLSRKILRREKQVRLR